CDADGRAASDPQLSEDDRLRDEAEPGPSDDRAQDRASSPGDLESGEVATCGSKPTAPGILTALGRNSAVRRAAILLPRGPELEDPGGNLPERKPSTTLQGPVIVQHFGQVRLPAPPLSFQVVSCLFELCCPPAAAPFIEEPHRIARDFRREVGVAHRHLDRGVAEQVVRPSRRTAADVTWSACKCVSRTNSSVCSRRIKRRSATRCASPVLAPLDGRRPDPVAGGGGGWPLPPPSEPPARAPTPSPTPLAPS